MAYNTNTTGAAATVAQVTTVTGSFESPVVVTQAGGITPGGYPSEFMFVKSDDGQFTISANPQIAPGTMIGQTLTLMGTDDDDAFAFVEGNGVFAGNAAINPLLANSVLTLTWIGTVWANMTDASVTNTAP